MKTIYTSLQIEKIDTGLEKVLVVDGVPQSVCPPTVGGYWRHVVPTNFKGSTALILGLGAGTVARLLLNSYPHLKITGVDNNSMIISAATKDFKLGELKMDIIIDDGFEYIKKTKLKFDLIIVDMWNGYWFPFKALSKEFIEDCCSKLNKKGQVYINTPSLDYLAKEGLQGLNALRDDIGRNIIYKWKLTKEKK